MNLVPSLKLANLFCAGILAGMEIVIHYGLRAPAETLADPAQLRLRQALILRLRVLVPAFFLPAALSGIAMTLIDKVPGGPWLRWGGLFCMLVWALIRVIGTVPINSATLEWELASPPRDWKAQVARAERFHDVGVWAAVLSYVCFLAAAGLPPTGH